NIGDRTTSGHRVLNECHVAGHRVLKELGSDTFHALEVIGAQLTQAHVRLASRRGGGRAGSGYRTLTARAGSGYRALTARSGSGRFAHGGPASRRGPGQLGLLGTHRSDPPRHLLTGVAQSPSMIRAVASSQASLVRERTRSQSR